MMIVAYQQLFKMVITAKALQHYIIAKAKERVDYIIFNYLMFMAQI